MIQNILVRLLCLLHFIPAPLDVSNLQLSQKETQRVVFEVLHRRFKTLEGVLIFFLSVKDLPVSEIDLSDKVKHIPLENQGVKGNGLGEIFPPKLDVADLIGGVIIEGMALEFSSNGSEGLLGLVRVVSKQMNASQLGERQETPGKDLLLFEDQIEGLQCLLDTSQLRRSFPL